MLFGLLFFVKFFGRGWSGTSWTQCKPSRACKAAGFTSMGVDWRTGQPKQKVSTGEKDKLIALEACVGHARSRFGRTNSLPL